ncbi:hypothetical protein AYJ57_15740 [Salipiger sp. CCB-MM3]|uniref:FG-GAP-like repeat-containing protein n=1 Tax=Salipiger sp. CCB-MM3 TaxID=1792508 RepID=UPI00080AC1DA|nr:FG-GAP-like repeat-containing protein [Salipiger sp. CCB-MM3]ANT61908.1 hypothetical protein AYJ57_15740 [Salipiger sp. CCB-MM3]
MPGNPFVEAVFSFPDVFLSAPISTGRTEAEALGIAGGFEIASNPHASGQAVLAATASSSQAGGVFSGLAGLYDLTVGYMDETDGVSHLEVLLNGAVIDAFDWDSLAGTAIVTAASKAEHMIAGVLLAPGDVLELSGAANLGEPLRTDYLDVTASTAVPPTGETTRMEAEDFTILSGFEIAQNGAASGGAVLQHSNSAQEARASYTLTQGGTFDLTIGYFDETDGVSRLDVLLNGSVLASFDWDSSAGSTLANLASRATYTLDGVKVAAGDVLELAGIGDGREPLRVDYVDLTAVTPGPDPTPLPALYEAEDFEIVSGFAVARNGAASGGYMLQATGSGEARAAWTFEETGTYDLAIGYFDETDGVASMRALLNGVQIAAFDWDGTDGSSIANRASATEHEITSVALEAGDRLELVGFADGREPLRTDYIRLTPTDPEPPVPEPSLDLLFASGGSLFIGLNDGDGQFEARDTGISAEADPSGLQPLDFLSGDFDGDGDSDILRVVADLPYLPAEDTPGYSYSVTTTLFANNGTGVFIEGTSTTEELTVNIGLDEGRVTWAANVFSAADISDIDGDGDLDLAALGNASNTLFVFENGGNGQFALKSAAWALLNEISTEAHFAEMNGDGLEDLVFFTAYWPAETIVTVNDGTGHFIAVDSLSAGEGTWFDDFEDVDNDGDTDVLFGAWGDGRGRFIYLNDGTGALDGGASIDPPGEDSFIGGAKAGNFDGDPQIEIVNLGANLTPRAPGLVTYDVVVGTERVELVETGYDPSIVGGMLKDGDFDLDGDLDLLARLESTGTVVLLQNDGAGNFTESDALFTADTEVPVDYILTTDFFDESTILI